jgi:mRNA-degrading endonuclease RelE of RelBE toxin-antitoxin system
VKFEWSPVARRDLRSIPREEAILILRKLTEWAETGRGDIRPLVGHYPRLRLRSGKWRVIFSPTARDAAFIHAVDNRGEAY